MCSFLLEEDLVKGSLFVVSKPWNTTLGSIAKGELCLIADVESMELLGNITERFVKLYFPKQNISITRIGAQALLHLDRIFE